VRDCIREANKNGATVLLTTHDLDDIENLCERMVIIDYGKIIYDGTLSEVKNRYARERTLRVQSSAALDQAGRAAVGEALADLPVKVSYPAERDVHIAFDKEGVPARDLLGKIIGLLDVADFTIDEPKIDTVIKQVYARTLDLQGADV
jgi:ABC-2 type transport system ATP-binding protein